MYRDAPGAAEPALKPGLLTVWRNRDTVQIGIDPRRAIALTGMRGAAVLLGLLDGSRDLAQILAAAGDVGISAEAADRVITLLRWEVPCTTFRSPPTARCRRLCAPGWPPSWPRRPSRMVTRTAGPGFSPGARVHASGWKA